MTAARTLEVVEAVDAQPQGSITPSKAAKPSPKQVYFIARLALRIAGRLELPETKADADQLIRTLKAALEDQHAQQGPADDSEIPF